MGEFRVERLVEGGEALVRTAHGTVFVEGVIPGEVVRIEQPSRAANGRWIAAVGERIEESPARVQPECPLFGSCGGCAWQYIDYPTQLLWKRRIIAENLVRLGGYRLEEGRIEVVHGSPYRYRARVQLHCAVGTWGFYRKRSHQVLPVTHCPVVTEPLERAMGEIAGERCAPAITVVEGAQRVFRSDRDQRAVLPLEGPYSSGSFSFSPRGFAQSNHRLLSPLGKLLSHHVRGTRLVDLYAGAGLLPVLIATYRMITELVAVEPQRANCRFITENVGDVAPHCRVSAHAMTAERAITSGRVGEKQVKGATVLLDPPRAGLSKVVRAWLLSNCAGVGNLLYVSCNAAALARDVGALRERYSLDRLVLFDFYPQTAHTEVRSGADSPPCVRERRVRRLSLFAKLPLPRERHTTTVARSERTTPPIHRGRRCRLSYSGDMWWRSESFRFVGPPRAPVPGGPP